MRVEGEVIMGGEGRVYITPGGLAKLGVHATHTLETRQKNAGRRNFFPRRVPTESLSSLVG